jgi:hypothetical protein
MEHPVVAPTARLKHFSGLREFVLPRKLLGGNPRDTVLQEHTYFTAVDIDMPFSWTKEETDAEVQDIAQGSQLNCKYWSTVLRRHLQYTLIPPFGGYSRQTYSITVILFIFLFPEYFIYIFSS